MVSVILSQTVIILDYCKFSFLNEFMCYLGCSASEYLCMNWLITTASYFALFLTYL